MTAGFASRAAAPAAATSVRSLVMAGVGWAGLAACLTMVFLAMRAVMGVGGSCAEGGPYVIAQPCPDGATPSLLLGIWAGLAFAFLASLGGMGLGGIWAATPVLAWSALFGSLGWNFLDLGVLSPPPGAGIDAGSLVCGVLFWIMAGVPLAGVVLGVASGRSARRSPMAGTAGASGGEVPSGADGSSGVGRRESPRGGMVTLPGPGQPARRSATVTRDGTTITTSSVILSGDELGADLRAKLDALEAQLAASADPGAAAREREALAGIAADFGAAIAHAVAEAPALPGAHADAAPPAGSEVAPVRGDPGAGATPPAEGAATPSAAAPAASVPPDGAEPAFTEGTQALLDRLERLADLRDRGLLIPAEYETAKAAIIAELEGRS